MAKKIQEILEFNTEQGKQNLAALRKEITDLKNALFNLEEGSEDYNRVALQLYADQQKINQVMRDTKQPFEAAAGSFNALTQELAALKEAWKATGNEADRAKLGEQINDVKAKINGMNHSIGNWQDNVGNYSQGIVDAFGRMGISIGALNEPLKKVGFSIEGLDTSIKLLQGSMGLINNGFAAAVAGLDSFVAGLSGMKKAILATGIGALVVALGAIVAYWDEISEAISKTKSPMETIIAETDEFYNSLNDAVKEADDLAAALGNLGASNIETATIKVYALKDSLSQAEGKLKEQETRLEELNTWWRRLGRTILSVVQYIAPVNEAQKKLFGTRSEVKGLNQAIETSKKEVEDYGKKVSDASFNLSLAMDKAEQGNKKVTTATRDRAAATKELIDLEAAQREIDAAIKAEGDPAQTEIENLQKAIDLRDEEIRSRMSAIEIEEQEYEKKKALLEEYNISTYELTLNHEEKMAKLRQDIADKQAAEEEKRRQEQKAAEDRQAADYKKLMQARRDATANMVSGTTAILRNLSSAFGENTKAAKGFAIAAATIDAIAAAVSGFRAGYNQWKDAGPMAWMAPVQGALNATMALTAGFAEVQKIRSVDTSGNSTGGGGGSTAVALAVPNIEGLSSPVDYTRQVTTQTEQEEMNRDNRVYILESDIQESNNRVKVREEETTF